MGFNRLTWGVKASFRGYVQAVEGTVTLADGATQADDGTFAFNALPGGDLIIASDGTASGSARFQGSVAFDAHGGMLRSTLSELGIEVGEKGLVLTANEAPMNKGRCVIADLGPAEIGADGKVTMGAVITLDGMFQIADNYPPGTVLDPVRLE